MTDFLPEHPGGPKIILKYAGKDGTEEYAPIHPPDTLDKYLDKSKHLGEVDMNTVEKEEKEYDPDEAKRQELIQRMPGLEQYVLIHMIPFKISSGAANISPLQVVVLARGIASRCAAVTFWLYRLL